MENVAVVVPQKDPGLSSSGEENMQVQQQSIEEDETSTASEPHHVLEMEDLVDFIPRAEETLQKVVNVTEEYKLALERAAMSFDSATEMLRNYLQEITSGNKQQEQTRQTGAIVVPLLNSSAASLEKAQVPRQVVSHVVVQPSIKRKSAKKKKKKLQKKAVRTQSRKVRNGDVLKFQKYLVNACGMLGKGVEETVGA